MHPINEFLDNKKNERVIVLDPSYPVDHEMRIRIVNRQFVKYMVDVTHFIELGELENKT